MKMDFISGWSRWIELIKNGIWLLWLDGYFVWLVERMERNETEWNEWKKWRGLLTSDEWKPVNDYETVSVSPCSTSSVNCSTVQLLNVDAARRRLLRRPPSDASSITKSRQSPVRYFPNYFTISSFTIIVINISLQFRSQSSITHWFNWHDVDSARNRAGLDKVHFI